jgi:hypothetical protein
LGFKVIRVSVQVCKRFILREKEKSFFRSFLGFPQVILGVLGLMVFGGSGFWVFSIQVNYIEHSS